MRRISKEYKISLRGIVDPREMDKLIKRQKHN
jgi:hypothetical protein